MHFHKQAKCLQDVFDDQKKTCGEGAGIIDKEVNQHTNHTNCLQQQGSDSLIRTATQKTTNTNNNILSIPGNACSNGGGGWRGEANIEWKENTWGIPII